MADKEATVFVIDVGASMGKCEQGREMTNLEWSMQFVWDKITAKVLYSSMDSSLMEGIEW
jgi:ATP-dependent DNA helicase 2 subunit 2